MYGWFMSAMGLGAVTGGLIVARRVAVGPRPIAAAAGLYGVAMVGVSLAPNIWMALGALFLVGAGSTAFMSLTNATVQLASRVEFRGRVMSLWTVAFAGSTPIGGPIVGAVAEFSSPRLAIAIGAVACVVAAIALLAVSRGRRRQQHPKPKNKEMTDMQATTDVCDADPLASVVELAMVPFGGVPGFAGEIATVRCHEDNVLVRRRLSEPGEGRVLVVDGGGSRRVALLGDQMAALAETNGWSGVVINGAIRDAAALRAIGIGIVALGANPRASRKDGVGAVDVPLAFGGVTFRPGDRLVADEDGIVVLSSSAT